MTAIDGPRLRNLRAALAFLRLPPTEPELRLLHRWLDTWTGVGLITVGVERQGTRLSLSHVTRPSSATSRTSWRSSATPSPAPRSASASRTSLLLGHERAKYLGVMDAVIENATDEAVLIPDGQGHPFAFGP
jgi:hypothetical protein